MAAPSNAHADLTRAPRVPPCRWRDWLGAVAQAPAAVACPRLTYRGTVIQSADAINAQYHHAPAHPSHLSDVVALFRRPFARAVSNYRYARSSGHEMSSACPPSAEALYRDRRAHERDAQARCHGGCQCKMLLGLNCVSCPPRRPLGVSTTGAAARIVHGSNLTAGQLDQCLRAVQRLRFVGTLETWGESVDRFCDRFRCPPAVRRAVLRHTRQNPAPSCAVPAGWADEADEALYAAAVERVRSEVHERGDGGT